MVITRQQLEAQRQTMQALDRRGLVGVQRARIPPAPPRAAPGAVDQVIQVTRQLQPEAMVEGSGAEGEALRDLLIARWTAGRDPRLALRIAELIRTANMLTRVAVVPLVAEVSATISSGGSSQTIQIQPNQPILVTHLRHYAAYANSADSDAKIDYYLDMPNDIGRILGDQNFPLNAGLLGSQTGYWYPLQEPLLFVPRNRTDLTIIGTNMTGSATVKFGYQGVYVLGVS